MTSTSYNDLLVGLNDEQTRAATITDKNVLILAGSGTGKTHVLVTRILISIARGIAPERIMAVTFSRRAAREVRERVEKMLDPSIDPKKLYIGTFHALSSRILRNSPALSPIGSEFTTLEDNEIDMVIGQALRKMKHQSVNNESQYKKMIRSIKKMIDENKNKGLDLNKAHELGIFDKETADIITAYQTFMRDRGTADFGDLIVSVITMMKNENAKRAWSNRFDEILVDEYQDINTSQGEWIAALKGENTNLTCFGDDDQVIYAWRGANSSYIRQFGSRYHNAVIITLNVNYRSPRPIVEAATRLIRNNPIRHEKDVRSVHSNQEDEKMAINVHAHQYSERHQRLIGVLRAESLAYDWKDMMVLTRQNAEAAEISEKLKEAGIPAILIKPSANDVPLMRKLSSWLRVVRNPHDATALAGILGVNDQDNVFSNIWTSAMLKNVDIVSMIRSQIDGDRLSAKIYRDFLAHYDAVKENVIDAINRMDNTQSTVDHLHSLFEHSGMSLELRNVSEGERLHFIALFQNLCADAVESDGLKSIEDLIQNQIPNRSLNDGVMISTMHGVKGLEAPIVCATSWSHSQFPRSMSDRDIDEQRRLAFVTVTRAKQRLHMFYDAAKGVSPFIKEMKI